MNLILVTLLYVTVGGLGVGIFLWGKPDGNSLFDRLYRVVCIHGPRLLKKALEKCFGKRGPAALDAAWVYVCYTSNPIVQIFYLLVLFGGYLTFVMFAYPHVPNRFASGYHKYTGFGVFCTCIYVWWRACKADPGAITGDNVGSICELYDWDEQIFAPADCTTCKQTKPARSKHCSLCDVCVARFDHHCIWLNNCVGIGNHKWFLAFLFWHSTLCLYGMGLGTVILYDIIIQKDLMNAVFIDPQTRERHPASKMIIVQYMLATEGMVVFVIILAAIMGIVLAGFFMWHLNLVRIGTTTNELSKWHYIKWCLKQEGPEGKERIKELRNIYNRGLLQNFREVLFPIELARLPSRQNGHHAGTDSAKEEVAHGSGKKGKKEKAKTS